MKHNRDEILAAHRMRQIEGARRFAAAEKSDPFAFRRAMAHINGGKICRPNNDGEPAEYSADPFMETRTLPDGREYEVEVYRNVKRP